MTHGAGGALPKIKEKSTIIITDINLVQEKTHEARMRSRES
jgi:hypothetical protein